MVNKMNIVSLFARSYVDAFSVAAGYFGSETPASRMRRADIRRGASTLAPKAAAKAPAGPREALDARF